jgi:hypothetical protein
LRLGPPAGDASESFRIAIEPEQSQIKGLVDKEPLLSVEPQRSPEGRNQRLLPAL